MTHFSSYAVVLSLFYTLSSIAARQKELMTNYWYLEFTKGEGNDNIEKSLYQKSKNGKN